MGGKRRAEDWRLPPSQVPERRVSGETGLTRGKFPRRLRKRKAAIGQILGELLECDFGEEQGKPTFRSQELGEQRSQEVWPSPFFLPLAPAGRATVASRADRSHHSPVTLVNQRARGGQVPAELASAAGEAQCCRQAPSAGASIPPGPLTFWSCPAPPHRSHQVAQGLG